MQRALTMELFAHQILRLKIFLQDYHSDDDVLVISDSDILEKKADFVELLDDDA